MNTIRTSGYGRLLAFFLIALGLVLIFGFAASGNDPEKESGTEDGYLSGNSPDDNTEADGENEKPSEPEQTKYFNYLTGLQLSEGDSHGVPVSFLLDTEAALYGVSAAEVLIEIPIENGKTRMLAITTSFSGLGKIGAIAPTRGYITTFARAFGSTLISYGVDDSLTYPELATPPEHLDLTRTTGYHYTEYSKYAYSNAALISHGLANSALGLTPPEGALPFLFADSNANLSGTTCSKITLPYSTASATELSYSKADGCYSIAKGTTAVYDMLSGEVPTFKNVILLYADSMTYETESETSFVMNTIGSGRGLYAVDGHVVNIRWQCSESGEMLFFTEAGERLAVSTGRTYIGLFKSSMSSGIIVR